MQTDQVRRLAERRLQGDLDYATISELTKNIRLKRYIRQIQKEEARQVKRQGGWR